MGTTASLERFSQRLDAYERWRLKLLKALESYQGWFVQQEDKTSSDELRMFELLELVRADKLTIALVGEFSRGKTELINAIFFGDYKRRLLPSTPGRTTMCPTEITYDPKLEPCIRLLPVETRKSAVTISELKRTTVNWTTLPLNLDSPDEMAETLQEIVRTKTVTVRQARALGFLSYGDMSRGLELKDGGIEIPVWRIACINYPHRLLEKGLLVFDTPGLNALGSEPELTLSMLPSAHAVLFVLAADTGVTRSDLAVWRNHVCVATRGRSESRVAVLNKIDTLWDELRDSAQIDEEINRQAEETMRVLDLGRRSVFPVSAYKGLLGKAKNDTELVKRSGLPALEKRLSDDIVAFKHHMLRNKVLVEIGNVVEASNEIISNRIEATSQELREIAVLRNKSREVIRDMTVKLQTQKSAYDKEVESFRHTRTILSSQVAEFLSPLSLKRFDRMVMGSRERMHGSWTTRGLRGAMTELFAYASDAIRRAEAEAEQVRQLVNTSYERFHTHHGLPKISPAEFPVGSFIEEFKNLEAEADALRKSPMMLVTEQHYVIRKFFDTLVNRARSTFSDCNASARNWAKAVLAPIYTQIQEHKNMLERRLETFQKLHGSHTALGQRIAETQQRLDDFKRKAPMVQDILEQLYEEPPELALGHAPPQAAADDRVVAIAAARTAAAQR